MSQAKQHLTVDQLLALAQRNLLEGRSKRATNLLDALLRVQPGEARARILMAQAVLASSPASGLRHLMLAEGRAKASPLYWRLRARAEARLARTAEAALSARRAIVLSPHQIDALFDGFRLIAGDAVPLAVNWSRRLLIAAPVNHDGWLCAAQTAIDARRGSIAYRHTRRAFLLSPADPISLLWLVRTATVGNDTRTLSLVRRFLPTLAADDDRTVAMVAHSLVVAGDLEGAIQLLQQYTIGRADRSDLNTNLALYQWRLRRRAPAWTSLRKALTALPGSPAALAAARTIAEDMRDYSSAHRWQQRYRTIVNTRLGDLRCEELKALTVYRKLLPRLDLTKRNHRLAATSLLGERQGAYHALEVAPGWSHQAVVGNFHHRRHEGDLEFCDLLWRLVSQAVRPAAGRQIVDIGPADGLITIRAAAAGANVTAIEPTSLFTERVELFSRIYDVADRVTVARGAIAIEHLPLLRAADAVVCAGVLYHLTDISTVIDVLTRSRRPLLMETSFTEEDWADETRGRLHEDRLPVSWPWLLRALEKAGYLPSEIAEWGEFHRRRSGKSRRRMLVALSRA